MKLFLFNCLYYTVDTTSNMGISSVKTIGDGMCLTCLIYIYITVQIFGNNDNRSKSDSGGN
jgi:hypothetical protein